jgi:hypothetical protein
MKVSRDPDGRVGSSYRVSRRLRGRGREAGHAG